MRSASLERRRGNLHGRMLVRLGKGRMEWSRMDVSWSSRIEAVGRQSGGPGNFRVVMLRAPLEFVVS